MVRHIDFNIKNKSVNELDEIAVHQNGIVGSLKGESDVLRASVLNVEIGDWKVKWVATISARHGSLKLVPTNSRTKSLMVKGKATYLSQKFNLTWVESTYLVDAMMGHRHMEQPGVLELIVGTQNDVDFWNSFKNKTLQEWIDQEMITPHWVDVHPIVRILKPDYLESAVRVHAAWMALMTHVAQMQSQSTRPTV